MSKAEKLIAKGRTLEGKGKLDKALDVFREATKLDPVDPEAWQARGELAARIGAPREAAESLFRVSDMYARAGMPREALKLIVRVLELDPQHEGARRFRRMLESKSAERDTVAAPPDVDIAPAVRPSAPVVEQAAPAPVVVEAPAPVVETEAPTQIEEVSMPFEHAPAPFQDAPVPVHVPLPPALIVEDDAPEIELAPAPAPADTDAATPWPVPLARGSSENPSLHTIELTADEPPPMEVFQAASSAPSVPVMSMEALAAPADSSSLPLASAIRSAVDSGTAPERAFGRITGELALESTISLQDHLPSEARGVGQAEISLDDEPKLDVVHAVASAIGSSPLLSELDSDLVKHLIDAGTLTRRPAHETVFRQGDAGTSLFLILAGEVAVVRDVAGEPPRELARLRAGAFFGEMALITNSPRSATVRVLAAADLLEVSRRAMRAMIEKEPRVLKLLMRFFRARLVGTLLQTSPVFEPFSREDRKKLVAAFRLRELGAGHAVFEEGSKAEGLFVLLAGRLEVLKGLDKVLGQLSPGDVFGEMSLLDGSVAMATVRAKTRSWVLLLPRHIYEELAGRYPQIRGQLRALADTRRARNEREVPGGPPAHSQREGRVEPV